MSRKTTFSIEENYHIYSRGHDKRLIFQNEKDYNRFLAIMYLCNNTENIHLSDHPSSTLSELLDIKRKDQLVDIGAYCLMPNHFHLLIHEKTESGISKFMQKILTAYTMYFNKKNERAGTLFSSSFKANHVDKDEYLKYLFSYIHLNPIKLMEPKWKETGISNKKGAEAFLNSYSYSSFPDYTNQERKQKNILNKEAFPKYFENIKEFKDFMGAWLSFPHA